MPMTIRRQQAGVSLVELMVALLLLGVALMGLAAAFAPGRMAIQAGDQATTATFLARRVLEDMRNRAYDLDTDELVNGTTFPSATTYGGITNYPNYRRTIAITDDAPEPCRLGPAGLGEAALGAPGASSDRGARLECLLGVR